MRRVLYNPSRHTEQFPDRWGGSRCHVRLVIRGSDNIRVLILESCQASHPLSPTTTHMAP
jgi:hypothetical protein